MFLALALFMIFTGICFRFYHINENIFVYYDEGMYLEQTRAFLQSVAQNPPTTLPQWLLFFQVLTKIALFSNKALWFFIAGLRGVFISADALYFTRIVSAVFGTLSIGLIYVFAKKFYNSRGVGLLSALLLTFYPSHIYYSRLGLQETFSAFCFLVGFYCYVFPRKISYKTFLSGFFFSCVFFTNYRMIIIPVLIVCAELLTSYSQNEKIQIKKCFFAIATFISLIGLIFLIGHFYQSKTASITIGWMFKQKDLAKGHFDIINLFSYPYYLFKLESVFWGLLFFGNIFYFLKYRKDKKRLYVLLPFVISIIQMAIFSFPQEKGSRYICVVMPLIVMASSYLLYDLYSKNRDSLVRVIVVIFFILMLAVHVIKGVEIIQYKSDYKTVMDIINAINPNLKVISSQNMIQNLYTKQGGQVKSLPDSRSMLPYYAKMGFRYLVIDPQAYISYTKDGKRFSLELKDYLQFISAHIPPDKVFRHFNDSLLERFVLEHNENLSRSLKFLKVSQKRKFGALRIYDIQKILILMNAKDENANEE